MVDVDEINLENFNKVSNKNIESDTIASRYLREDAALLSSSQQNFIKSMQNSYYSFYQIKYVIKNQSLGLVDLLLGDEHIVLDKLGTTTLQVGDIVCSSILNIDSSCIFVGMLPFNLKKNHVALLNFKKLLKSRHKNNITPKLLREKYLTEILDLSFALIEIQLDNQKKFVQNLRNTDGDQLAPHKLCYNIRIDIKSAINNLLPLAGEKNDKDILDNAEYSKGRGKKDNIIRVEFPWTKKTNKIHNNCDNIILGNIILTPDKLTIEVNSENRAKKIQKLIEKYLRGVIDTPSIAIESLEHYTDLYYEEGNQLNEEVEALYHNPEIKKYMQEMMSNYYQDWCDMEITALHHQTPRETSKTVEGRKQLDILFREFEVNINNNSSKDQGH